MPENLLKIHLGGLNNKLNIRLRMTPKDEMHLKAMSEIQELMQNPEAMEAWFENKKKN